MYMFLKKDVHVLAERSLGGIIRLLEFSENHLCEVEVWLAGQFESVGAIMAIDHYVLGGVAAAIIGH